MDRDLLDRDLLERLLARTMRRIGELERHIERQRQIVAEFDASNHGHGESGDIARDLLQALELNLRREINHRKRLSAQLRA